MQEAEDILRRVLILDPGHSASHLALARLLISSKRGGEALPHIEAIPALADEYESAVRLKEVMAFQTECQKAGGESTCQEENTKGSQRLGCKIRAGFLPGRLWQIPGSAPGVPGNRGH